MASRPTINPFEIEVRFEPRDDGGLRATCQEVPGFFLSHSNPERVRSDVGPALKVILSDMLGIPVDVERLSSLAAERDDAMTLQAHLCDAQRYVGLRHRA